MPARKPTPTIAQILEPEGRLSQTLEGYQYRTEQAEVSHAIEEAFNTGKHGLVEAGTGVGKTLAYLIPAIRAAARGKVTVISTHTLNLQAQLIEKDIPLVQSLFPEVNVKAVVMKGRGNYLCRQDLDSADADLFHTTDPLFRAVKTWVRTTETGDVAELDFSYPNWMEIAANQDTCRQKDCSYYERCFYYKMRWNATDANLIVVNHALYLSDLALRRADPQSSILPHYDFVVFDEAHHLETVATKVFGLELGNRRIPYFVERVRRARNLDISTERLQELDRLNEELFTPFQGARPDFFVDEMLDAERKKRMEEVANEICERLGIVSKELTKAAEAEEGVGKDRLQGMSRMAGRLHEEVHTLMFKVDPDYIRWGEHSQRTESRGRQFEPRTTLYHTPIEVGKLLEDMLWNSVESAILTSATLANSGGFSYLRARLAVPEPAVEQVVGSPFRYKEQAMLYVPAGLPQPPKTSVPAYTEKVVCEIERVLTLTNGRAFLLFTSRRMLNEVYELLRFRLPYTLFRQGEMPAARLLEAFRDSTDGCLFGTQTFWEGVDVQGAALSCVIIDRLPFAVPDSPVTRARTNAITAAGGDWFREYSIPQAQIRLKQGFGRLIRTQTDRGIVCILDTRLLAKDYGKEFVKYLPPASRASLWPRVERFWKVEKGEESVVEDKHQTTG